MQDWLHKLLQDQFHSCEQLPKLMNLIEECWDFDPDKRPPLDKILQSLAEIDTASLRSSSDQCEVIRVDNDSAEFERVYQSFTLSLQQHHEDYVLSRLKNEQKPIAFKLKSVWRIENYSLRENYENTVKMISKQHSEKDAGRVHIGYHGTRPTNLNNIAKHGLLKVGNPHNPSPAVDKGYFGDPQQGIYLSRYVEYSLKYSNQKAPLKPDDKVKIIQFKLFPGKTLHIDKMQVGINPTEGYNSHSSPQYLEWYLFDEKQCCPEYILEVEAFENNRTLADDA